MDVTLKELNAQEQARHDRAARFEALSNDIYRLVRMVKALEAKRAEIAPALEALSQVRHLAEQLAVGLVTSRGSSLIPGGFDVKLLLTDLVTKAHADVQVKVSKADVALTKSRSELAKAQARLKEFQS